MRKVVSGLFISLDGVTQSPNEWQFDVWDADMEVALAETIASSDTVLLGRNTYQEWAPFWPTSSIEPFASFINQIPKYVISSTLEHAPWGDFTAAHLVRGNLRQAIANLKTQPGKNIAVTGSPTLVQGLIEHDLLDELTLIIHPVVVGHGKRLFADEATLKRMRLVSSSITGSGVALLTYQPRN